ncbi:MAG: hypothetical protein AB7G75_29735 [Candidatus Binatia bacterium]
MIPILWKRGITVFLSQVASLWFICVLNVEANQFVNPWGQLTGTLVVSPVNGELTFGWLVNDGRYHKTILPIPAGQELVDLRFDAELVRVDTDVTVFAVPLQNNQFLSHGATYTVWTDNLGGYIGFDQDSGLIRGRAFLHIQNIDGNLSLSVGSGVAPFRIIEAPLGFDAYNPPANFGFGFVTQSCNAIFPFFTAPVFDPLQSYPITVQGTLLREGFLIGVRRQDLNLGLEDCTRDHIDHYHLKFTVDTSRFPVVLRATLQRFGRPDDLYSTHSLQVGQLIVDNFGPVGVSGDRVDNIQPDAVTPYVASAQVIDDLNDLLQSSIDDNNDGFVDVPLYIVDDSFTQEVYRGTRVTKLTLLCRNFHDLDCDGNVDSDDVKIILAARGPARATDDPRDLDGDGQITVLDARTLTLFCTKARCSP